MTVDQINELQEKAKTRKDGVYVYRGVYWAVRGGNFIAFADISGNCYQRSGFFNTFIGKVQRYERKKRLTNWLRNL